MFLLFSASLFVCITSICRLRPLDVYNVSHGSSCVVNCSTIQCSTKEYISVQYSAVHYGVVQYGALQLVQYRTVHCGFKIHTVLLVEPSCLDCPSFAEIVQKDGVSHPVINTHLTLRNILLSPYTCNSLNTSTMIDEQWHTA